MSMIAISRLIKLDHLIRMKATGNPEQLADKLGVSRRCVFDYINILKELGAPVAFSKSRTSYYYTENGNCNFQFLKK
jgi:predicted DNA-binding transcriptional regulator YafY